LLTWTSFFPIQSNPCPVKEVGGLIPRLMPPVPQVLLKAVEIAPQQDTPGLSLTST